MDIKGGSFLVTGGASLIGSHIAEHLLAAGARLVTIFDNYSLGTPEALRPFEGDERVRVVRGDILRQNELYDALEGVAGIFAVAGFLTLPLGQNPALGLDVNVRGMLNVLEAARYRGVGKVIFCSSVSVYGDCRGGDIDESAPFAWASLSPAGVIYGSTKIIGENLCRLYRARHGVNSLSLRYSTVYGERQHYRGVNALYIMEAYDAIKAGKPPVLPDDGSEVHDYIYVGDVARANLMAMASDAGGESLNIVSGVDTSLNRLVDILLEQCGSALKPIYRNDPGKTRVTASPLLGFRRERAEAVLGWKPEVGIEEGIARLIAWRESIAAR